MDGESVFDCKLTFDCRNLNCQLAVKSDKVLTLLNCVNGLESKSHVFDGSWNVVGIEAIILIFFLSLSVVRVEKETFVNGIIKKVK